MKLPPALRKEVGGLPLGVWIGLFALGIAIGIYLRNRRVQLEEDTEGLTVEDEDDVILPAKTVDSQGGRVDFPTGSGKNYNPPKIIIFTNPCKAVVCPKGYYKTIKAGKCVCKKRRRRNRK